MYKLPNEPKYKKGTFLYDKKHGGYYQVLSCDGADYTVQSTQGRFNISRRSIIDDFVKVPSYDVPVDVSLRQTDTDE